MFTWCCVRYGPYGDNAEEDAASGDLKVLHVHVHVFVHTHSHVGIFSSWKCCSIYLIFYHIKCEIYVLIACESQ